MDFSLNDDHLALRAAVQRFCEGEYPAEHRGSPERPEQTDQRWASMAALGLLGLPLPTDHGGSGLGAVEVMVAAQEMGRALAGGAFVSSTVVAGGLIARLGSPAQQAQWLPALASGDLRAALAVNEAGARHDWMHCACAAHAERSGWTLQGRKTLVLHGDRAGLFLVLARTSGAPGAPSGLSLFAVEAGAAGVTVQGFDTLDGRRAAHLSLENVRVSADHMLGVPEEAGEAVSAALDAGAAALCAEAAGALEALLEQTAEHLRTRKQFGAPLAKFQVLQHRVADMLMALEQVKSMACVAAMAVQAGDPVQRRRLVSAAKMLAGQQGRTQGLAAIQMHGAMGMTDECRVGHYAKRLMVIDQLFGDAAWHRQRLVTP